MDEIDDKIRKQALGTYLHIRIEDQLPTEQGKLMSVDWNKRTFVLRNNTYNEDKTIAFSKIAFMK